VQPLFIFDRSRHELTGPDGNTIKLRPQSLEVFVLLLENANEVVKKETILNTVWKSVAVTDDSVTQCVVDIRRALGEQHRSLLQTIPRVGYRLCLGIDELGCPVIAPFDFEKPATGDLPAVESAVSRLNTNKPEKIPQPRIDRSRWFILVFAFCTVALLAFVGLGERQTDNIATPGTLPLRGPTLAVLPFQNVSAFEKDRYFSDGITEDIISLLSRFSELGLVSWRTISSRTDSENNIEAMARDFEVRYLISGSVRQENNRVRVAVRLTDARDARLLWSERYDEELKDVFLVQDRIASQIVASLSVKLTEFETALSHSTPTNNIEAYQLSLLGRSELRKRTREGNLVAREHFAAAIELDPDYADAYIRLGETYLEEALFGWTEWPEQSTEKALILGTMAIELDGATARSLGFLAHVHVRTGENAKAQTYLDRAFEFNPNDPSLHEIQGLLHLWNGEAEMAIAHLEYVRRYDPDSTLGSSHLSTAYYVAGRPLEAVSTIERMMETAPNTLFNHIILTAAFVESGDIESAKAAADVVRRQHPFFTADGASRTEFFANNEVRRRFVGSLRLVGLD